MEYILFKIVWFYDKFWEILIIFFYFQIFALKFIKNKFPKLTFKTDYFSSVILNVTAYVRIEVSIKLKRGSATYKIDVCL